MIGENGYPETPDWQLPRPVVSTDRPIIPPNIVLGDDGALWLDLAPALKLHDLDEVLAEFGIELGAE